MTIAQNLSDIRARIAAAEKSAGRAKGSVALVAVTKTFGPDAVEAAIGAGQLVFGENRVQEAEGKFPALKEKYPELRLHLIGPLQSNKSAEAVALFDVIHTVDRPKIAGALAKEIQKQGRAPRLFIQVNTGAEPQKAGVLPEEADAFLKACRGEYGLSIEGLMCIPPAEENPAPHFALLEKLAKRSGLKELSMGMSSDFESAVPFGATYVRVGSAIFGVR